MRKATATEKRTGTRPRASPGRPPRELAGEVEHRILEAARGVFLESGLSAASIDEIARRAHAGKTTIYARFPTKEALFAAVILHNASLVQAQFSDDRPIGITVEDRLVSVGTSILNHLLTGDTIDFIRLSAAEARRFPDLVQFGRMARERAAQKATQVLREIASSDEIVAYPGLAPERLEKTTHLFLDLVVSRILLQALLGESVEQLRTEIETHVSGSIAVFLAACRDGAIR